VIVEAGTYPRHRVCGEFISGRGLEVLERLGLRTLLEQAGTTTARTSRFYIGERSLPRHALPTPALCVSRFVMDAVLADEFRKLGGELHSETRWTDPLAQEGVVRATGRRVRGEQVGARWFGLKAHVCNVTLEADLEMHFAANSYVGLCRLPGGEVNVCGLFRRSKADSPLPLNAVARLSRESSDTLSDRLRHGVWDEASFCSVGGLPFQGKLETATEEVRIGDAMAMIPPVTGNGMSMALESADLALDPLAEFAEGKLTWTQSRRTVATAHRRKFHARLYWADRLHAALFAPALRDRILPFVASSETLWRLFFRVTR
jgi:flavin-dependent dehydrogenase